MKQIYLIKLIKIKISREEFKELDIMKKTLKKMTISKN